MSSAPEADPLLITLVHAALAGARCVMAVYATDFDVQHKADESPVSAADREAEAAILAHLAAILPDIPVVAEEAVSEGTIPQTGPRFFLVDPLDGTKEFISRNGEFTVNIGLIENAVPTAGIVLAPALGLAYAGARRGPGRGASARAALRSRRGDQYAAAGPARPPLRWPAGRIPTPRLKTCWPARRLAIGDRSGPPSNSASLRKQQRISIRASGRPWNGTLRPEMPSFARPAALS
jgi:hypothetical protein